MSNRARGYGHVVPSGTSVRSITLTFAFGDTTPQPLNALTTGTNQFVIQSSVWSGSWLCMKPNESSTATITRLGYVNDDDSTYPDLTITWPTGANRPHIALASTAGPANGTVSVNVTQVL